MRLTALGSPQRVLGAASSDAAAPVIFAVFQTGFKANGGVESITQVMARLRRIRPIVITQLKTPLVERWRGAGSEVHVWPLPLPMGKSVRRAGLWAHALRLAGIVMYNARMAALVRRRGVRVVHANDILGLLHVGVGARLAGARVVQNVRDIKAADEPYGWRWRLGAAFCDAILTSSREMASAAGERISASALRASGRVCSIYSIVDPVMRPLARDERAVLRARLGIPSDGLALGYVRTSVPDDAALLAGDAPARLRPPARP